MLLNMLSLRGAWKSAYKYFEFKFMQIIRRSTKKFTDIQIHSVKGYNILFNKLPDFEKAKYCSTRDGLWEYEFSKFQDQAVTLIELGVHKGYSIKKFCNLNKNQDSRFFGLDSFIGLPEDWTVNAKRGFFSTNGKIPEVNDSRVEIIPGWVQNTLPELLKREEIKSSNNLIVNYDLDIYSATIFSLTSIHSLKKTYLAFFDELLSQEICALDDYLQATGSNATLQSFTRANTSYPFQSSFIIDSSQKYKPKKNRLDVSSYY